MLFDFDLKQARGMGLLKGGRGNLKQDLQYHKFYLEKGEVIILTYYYVLVL